MHRQTNYKISPVESGSLRELWGFSLEINQYNENNITSLEGAIKFVRHKRRERDPNLIKQAKELFIKRHGYLFCEFCGFSFEETYGAFGKDYIEAHHKKPISTRQGNEITHIKDLMMLCSNCHRMVHRENGMNYLKHKFKKIKVSNK